VQIVAIETLQLAQWPELIWLEIATDTGLVGLGETARSAEAVAGYIHGTAAPLLLGQDATRIERIGHTLRRGLTALVGFSGTGAEMRGASAIDLALWDLLGQAAGLPLYRLLGGLAHERMRVYNTCNGYRPGWRRRAGDPGEGYWRLLPAGRPEGPYEDLEGFINRADELAASLIEEGIGALKIYPFNAAAEASGGVHLSREDLRAALVPFEKIRRAHGDGIEILVDFHGLWDLPVAKEIARALADFRPFWLEDPIKMDSPEALGEYARATPFRVCASETIATRWGFRPFLERAGLGVVMVDMGWCGGLSEAKKIAAMAEMHALPVAPHDATGPVNLMAGLHFVLSCPNGLLLEIVRSYLAGFYREIATSLPRIEQGFALPPEGSGLGLRLKPELRGRADARVRRSALG
jgi:galactonate dehydratase